MRKIAIDMEYVKEILLQLLAIPSPSGYTDEIVHFAGQRFADLGIPFELTRRGAIRADLAGEQKSPDRAIVAHLDTLGAMVKQLKANGRLAIVPIGHWSARFAEGARTTIFTDDGSRRGTILPLKASGHTFGTEIDTQPVAWENLEIRVDEVAETADDLVRLGFQIGDFVAIDSVPEASESGFINARHLDDKAGVACLFGAAKAVLEAGAPLPIDCHLLLTISEEVGSGASAVLHGDVSEMVAIDNGTQAPGQNSKEFGVTISMMDASGPFDYHLTHKLLGLCRDFGIPHQRDIFRYYRTDAASAIEAGNDIRTALLCFGIDSSHGYERIHLDALKAVAELLALYMQSGPTLSRDRFELSPLKGFSHQPT